MGKLTLEITEEPIVGNAGLVAMGELMRISDIDSTCAKRESPSYQVAEKDILRSLGGLIGIGKVGIRRFAYLGLPMGEVLPQGRRRISSKSAQGATQGWQTDESADGIHQEICDRQTP